MAVHEVKDSLQEAGRDEDPEPLVIREREPDLGFMVVLVDIEEFHPPDGCAVIRPDHPDKKRAALVRPLQFDEPFNFRIRNPPLHGQFVPR